MDEEEFQVQQMEPTHNAAGILSNDESEEFDDKGNDDKGNEESAPTMTYASKTAKPPSSKKKRFSITKGIQKMFGISSNNKHDDQHVTASTSTPTSNMNKKQAQSTFLPNRNNQSRMYDITPKRIHTDDWDKKPPCAVIVTIYSAISFDNLFRAIVQQSPDPESSIALFEMDYDAIPFFLDYLRLHGDLSANAHDPLAPARGQAIKQVMDAIDQVSPSSVVFNFECCGNCSDSGFKSPGKSSVMQFVKALIDAGFMIMFGDYSLKALIHDWDVALLGPNPFDRVGTCNASITIAFDSQQLNGCPSGQLQNVGKLNDGISTAELHCMSSTIVCTLHDESKYAENNDLYTLEVLTIATKLDNKSVLSS